MMRYQKHSDFSDPGGYADWYRDLTDDILILRDFSAQFFMHYADLSLYGLFSTTALFSEMNCRYISRRLEKISKKHHLSGLAILPPDVRPLGICRDSALLLCSVLREKGVPARLRSGFSSYFIPGFWLDGFCVDYYDTKLKRWARVDARTNDKVQEHYRMENKFCFTDLPEEAFQLAASVWQAYRKNKINANQFGSRSHCGVAIIRNRLIQDLACLLKREPLIWDIWGMMLQTVSDDFDLLDRLSDLLLHASDDWEALENIYEQHDSLKIPGSVLVDSPFCESFFSVHDKYLEDMSVMH